MLTALRQLLARALVTPVRAVHGAVHRQLTGGHAILEVRVQPERDAAARQGLVRALRRAVRDPQVEAVLLHVDGPPGGRAAIQDLRRVLRELHDAGKATYAFLHGASNAELWVATAAERVFLVPTAEVFFVGLGAELVFVGQALERLGVEPEVFAAGAYKSAGEMFSRSFASPSNLEAIDSLLDDLQRQMLEDIAADRKLQPEVLEALLARAPLSAEEAVVDGLVDRLLYEDQLDDWLEEHHGERAKRVKLTSWSRRAAMQEQMALVGSGAKTVAVLHLEGPIHMEGDGRAPRIRARTVVPMLDALRKDDDVVAVVLHVNSPGGGVLPSDLIWRAVERLRKAKPVIASYEDVSASGGVYLSSPATEVFARPGTLTGSIGVVGIRFLLGDALRRVGITHQAVRKAPNATMLSAFDGFTDAQRERFREQLDRWYDGFVHRVAQGRDVPEDTLEPHCRGRVWTGRMAEPRGIVDRLGDLDDAFARAVELAGVEGPVRRRDILGHATTTIELLMREVMGDRRVPGMARLELLDRVLQRVVGERALERVDTLLELEGEPVALLPFDLEP